MRKLAIVSRKGGTGKTTLAVNLATAAYSNGRKVVLADVDGQRSSQQWSRARGRTGPSVQPTSAGGLFQLSFSAERQGADLLIVDTPGSFEDGVLTSIKLSDLCVLVTRPNYLDIASLLTTAEAVRQLGRPALVVLNQAPCRRNGFEAPLVDRAIEALRFTGLPIATVGLRARVAYQTAMSRGLSVFEWEPGGAAAEEVRRLWTDVEAHLARPAIRAVGEGSRSVSGH
jgi:chromosome partitioning protein